MIKTSWSLSQIWNQVRDVDKTHGYEKRDHIWASELGTSYYDRYWKMHGRNATTPPNLRAQRKFDSGNLTEWVVKQILVRAHIYHEQQGYIVNEEGDLKVTGKSDFIAGGAIEFVDSEDIPDVLEDISSATLAKLSEDYPDGLPMQGMEIKSISGFAFSMVEKEPFINHALQSFHYAYNRDIPFHLIYICKDDLRTVEYIILPGSERYKKLYFEDIKRMAEILKMDKPPLEPYLLLQNEKFKKNLRVEYSNYLDDYGYERPDDYAEQASKLCGRLNRVLKRREEGKEMTDKNMQAIDEGIMFCSGYKEKHD